MKLHVIVNMKVVAQLLFAWLCAMAALCLGADCLEYKQDISTKAVGSTTQDRRPCDGRDSFRARFGSATGVQLQQMKTGSDDMAAIRAAWEEVRRLLPKPDENVMVRNPSTSVPVPHIGDFIGFVEGRLLAIPPEWWISELRTMRAYDFESFLLFREVPHRRGPRGLATEYGVVPQISRENKKDVVIAWKKLRIRVPNSAVPYETYKTAEQFAGIIAGNRCYVAHFIPFAAAPFDLCCINVASSTIIWSAKVWCGCSMVPGAGGLGHHEVGLVDSNGTIFVFGMEDRTAYIEGFRPSDGVNVFRFSIMN